MTDDGIPSALLPLFAVAGREATAALITIAKSIAGGGAATAPQCVDLGLVTTAFDGVHLDDDALHRIATFVVWSMYIQDTTTKGRAVVAERMSKELAKWGDYSDCE